MTEVEAVRPLDLTKRTVVVVTGATSGIGRSLAEAFAARLQQPASLLVLYGRSSEKLAEVKKAVQPCPARLITHQVDFANVSADVELFPQSLIEQACSVDIEQAVIVHNAGSLGDISRYSYEFYRPNDVGDYLNVNFSTTVALNSQFFRYFDGKDCLKFVVHISSLCAIQPVSSWSLYCAGKAARNMFFRCLAVERSAMDDTIVLNYGPGPVDTQMQVDCRTKTADQSVRKMFMEMNESGRLVQPADTVGKLFELLVAGRFKSGDHVDYYDV